MEEKQTPLGSENASQTGSEAGQTVELTDEQRMTIRNGRYVMFGLLLVFITCAIFPEARLPFCVLQLVLIGSMACFWEEDSVLATSEDGVLWRLVNIFSQLVTMLVPLGCAGWMSWIVIQAAGNIQEDIVLTEPYTFVNLTGMALDVEL
mmetsp:Transcript_4269/g.10281  ORF Transcript_4269/g.10281 Transcript_4269/m.10281 type:complete len:149 (-) Transcript_4269:64-510(-)